LEKSWRRVGEELEKAFWHFFGTLFCGEFLKVGERLGGTHWGVLKKVEGENHKR